MSEARYFDIGEFNKTFEASKEAKQEQQNKEDIEKLKKMNQEIYRKKINEMSIDELMIDWKSSLIGILNDLLNFRWNPDVLFADNRLFFLGMTIILFVIGFFFFIWMFGSSQNKNVNEYHIFMKK